MCEMNGLLMAALRWQRELYRPALELIQREVLPVDVFAEDAAAKARL